MAQQPRPAPADAERDARLTLREEFGGAMLLAADLKLAFVLCNEARYRAFELVGVPRDQANLATFVAILMAADALQRAQQTIGTTPRPSRGDAFVGAATANELLRAVGGSAGRQHPAFGPLVAVALVARYARPALRRSRDGIRAVPHRLRLSFEHRYGPRMRSPATAPGR